MGVCQCVGLEIAFSKSKDKSKHSQAPPQQQTIAIHNFQKQKSSNSENMLKNKEISKQSKESVSFSYKEVKCLSTMDTFSKSEKREDDILTIHIVGKEETGKTSLVIRLLKNKFDPFYIPSINIETTRLRYSSSTIGEKKEMQFHTYNFSLFDIKKVKNDDFVFVFFDLTNTESIDKAMSFITENNLMNVCNKERMFLVGNKSDLKKINKLPQNKMESFCTEHGIHFFEISVKTNFGIKHLFYRVCSMVSDNSLIKDICLTPPLISSHKFLGNIK